MKNIKITILTVIAVLGWSCNMDKYPYDKINSDNAMESVADCEAFRAGLYSNLKYQFTGGFIYYQDLMSDYYHALRNFGNWGGTFYHYSLTASHSEVETVWNAYYATIGNANFLIEGTQKLIARGTLSAADEALVKQFYGEACYIRAHMYYELAQKFCEDYNSTTAGSVYGVPVVTVYAPTADASKYPSRGTLAETYAQILADIVEAEANITEQGSQNAEYVTNDAVTAFKARVALQMEDYDTALTAAQNLISSGRYPLISNASAFRSYWVNDVSTENIFLVKMQDYTDSGNSMQYFIYNNPGEAGTQYIPEDWVLALYDQTNDIRYDAYFEEVSLSTPVVGDLTIMVKFPGNPILNANNNASSYRNMPKVFRIAEMYLVAAEAAYFKGGQDAVASTYLNTLKHARIANWTDVNYSGITLFQEIRDERVREMFGEGTRIPDLKRWGLGFSRTSGQDPDLVFPGENYASLSMPAESPRFLWPIPTSEIEANPQIANEQNSAYK